MKKINVESFCLDMMFLMLRMIKIALDVFLVWEWEWHKLAVTMSEKC